MKRRELGLRSVPVTLTLCPEATLQIHFIQIKPAEPVYTALPNTENRRTSEGPYSS
jgi:hypothetical protein